MRTLTISSGLIIAVAGFALAACSDRLVEAPPLGGSVAQNSAAQIVDPNPDSTEIPPPLNGERNNVGQKRYEKGQVLKPANVRTSSTTSANSSNSGGN